MQSFLSAMQSCKHGLIVAGFSFAEAQKAKSKKKRSGWRARCPHHKRLKMGEWFAPSAFGWPPLVACARLHDCFTRMNVQMGNLHISTILRIKMEMSAFTSDCFYAKIIRRTWQDYIINWASLTGVFNQPVWWLKRGDEQQGFPSGTRKQEYFSNVQPQGRSYFFVPFIFFFFPSPLSKTDSTDWQHDMSVV